MNILVVIEAAPHKQTKMETIKDFIRKNSLLWTYQEISHELRVFQFYIF